MASNPSNSPTSNFPTPQPRELKSKENIADMLDRLEEEQGSETESIDDQLTADQSRPVAKADILDDMDETC